ncbi:hypothetical protein L484_023720 [Morus notabilis]|uniref:Uncharacterized protein n=1 Tax=Morus notabilis TaxID=981085 RepID=W9QYI0_9ROSA|nr:hypothetical protein L484_023720 [Morus notabilis]
MISDLYVSSGGPTQPVPESQEDDNGSINFSQSRAKSFRSETISGDLVVKIENADTIMVRGQQAGKNGARSGNVCVKASVTEAGFRDPGGTWTNMCNCNMEGPDSGQIWTGARDEGRKLVWVKSPQISKTHGGRGDLTVGYGRRGSSETFGAWLTISGTVEAGLGDLAAVWTRTHDSGDVEAVSGRYSSDPLNSGDIMSRTWKFGSKPRVGGAEFRNSSQMRNGSRNSSTPGARDGELDFIGIGLGHSANGRSDISKFVTPKTKISMFLGLNNGSNGFSALDCTYVAPFLSWFVTVEVGSSRIAMLFNILKGGLDNMGRRWRHSTAVT